MKSIKKIIVILFPVVCGIIVGLAINTNSYQIINKPPFSPPALVFPIAWSFLYLLMGISLYLTLKKKGKIINFTIQLTVNLIWPILFFSLKYYLFAILWLVILIYFVIATITDFFNVNKIAGYLQIPYFIWLLFALYLNIGVAILN